MRVIFKIASAAEWEEAQRTAQFHGSAVDRRDGYIHFSTSNQVAETAARHFAGIDGLVLAAIDADALGPALKWEPSRGGDLFPHLYGALSLAHVLWVKALPLDTSGRHIFPDMGEDGRPGHPA
jgi:uncharacterized protein (DUF952 family)